MVLFMYHALRTNEMTKRSTKRQRDYVLKVRLPDGDVAVLTKAADDAQAVAGARRAIGGVGPGALRCFEMMDDGSDRELAGLA